VLVIIFRRLGTLDDPKLFRPWSFRIASREAFRYIKKRRLWQGRHEDDAQLDDFPATPAPPPGDLLRQILATGMLSPASRAVLLLHFEEELSLPEVAAILGIPLGTAKSRLAYGLRTIRQHLHASGGSHG
jgi:RNA polymerase sigma-70 factor (ECF subfamily)